MLKPTRPAPPPPLQHQNDGVKDTVGKPMLRLIPYSALVAIAKVREFGNRKYKLPWKWRELGKPDDFIEAAQRHIAKHLDPDHDDIDGESGLPHIYHAACTLSMAIDLIERDRDEEA